jgi:hypothetical protein
MLIDFGDFLYSNKTLIPSGYVEEWYAKDLQNAVLALYGGDIGKAAEACKIPSERLEGFIFDPFKIKPSIVEAAALCRILAVPLAPNCTHYWTSLTAVPEVEALRKWLAACDVT